jgi:hypothetical protein
MIKNDKKILWAIAIFALTIYLIFWHYYVRPFDFSSFIKAIGFISTFLTLSIFSSILTFLVALFPIKNKNYKARLSFFFPTSITLVCIVFGLIFYSNGPHYYTIKSGTSSDCKSVHDGIFQTGNLLIERKGNHQIQTNTKINEKEHFEVIWLTDCEYQLNSVNEIVRVKIVSVDQNSYDCYVLHNGRTSKRLKVQRQNKSALAL